MQGFFQFLADNPYILLFFTVGMAVWVGKFSVKGYGLGMIGHDGQVFERDLGPKTEDIVRAMAKYDPDSAWKEVPDTPPLAAH